MGKLADALEKQKKLTAIETEKAPLASLQPEPGPRTGLTGFSNPKLIVISEPESIDAENFKVLKSEILFSKNNNRPRSIMVTSAFPAEGKTFVSANLAASIALGIDEYVLAIDCDLRRPHLHDFFGYKNTAGLHEYLIGQKTIPELLIKTKIDKLSLITAGQTPRNPMELLSSAKMENFLNEVKNRYQDRLVIIDTTPFQATAEAGVISKTVDGIVLVVMANRTPREAVQKTIKTVKKEKIIGVFFNGYEKADQRYKKYYKQYYGR